MKKVKAIKLGWNLDSFGYG